jgi:hypothetical protein
MGIFYLLITINLFNVVTQQDTAFYKDIRFWLVMLCLVALVLLTVNSYHAA